MFSGIVQELGTIEKLEDSNGILDITVSSRKLISNLHKADSIAINGCCQTIVSVKNNSFIFNVQAVEETLKRTNFSLLKKGSKVNLEPSLKLGDSLDGHLVTGHIDACGTVLNITASGENTLIKISFGEELRGFIAPKGSISVNGVSLTVIDVEKSAFTFTLIPYSRDNTNLGELQIGDLVNLEVDLVSRYLVNYLKSTRMEIKN